MQGDILDLEELQETFDVIECVGVLHHMDDPMKGWGVFSKFPEPAGLMRIGLYSNIARRYLAEAQKELKKKPNRFVE